MGLSGTTPGGHDVDSNATIDVEKQSKQPDGDSGPGRQNGSAYQPRTIKFWLTISCTFLSLFIVALDRTIIATAIPRITDDFNSLGDIGWYGSAYMLTASSSQLIYGRIYKFYDMELVFLPSIVIFEIGSAICGAAPNSGTFIAGRAIAGLSSAGIFTGCMLIMIPLIPLHKRPIFQSMFGIVFGVASALGPLIGGGFTNSVTWRYVRPDTATPWLMTIRWCFYINIPIGAVTLIFLLLAWNPPKSKREPVPIAAHFKRLDPLGMLFFVPSIVSLLLALQWGGSTYSWGNGRVIALFIVFCCLLLAFATVQVKMPETATIPARMITHRSVICTVFYTFLLSSAMMLTLYYLPLWCKGPSYSIYIYAHSQSAVQTVKLVNPIKSGIYILPFVLSLVAASFLSGFVTQKIGYYAPAMYLSPCLLSIGLGLMSTFNLHTGSSHWVGYQFLAGFGQGMGTPNGGLVIQRVLPPTDIPVGVALVFFAQQLGGSVFTTVGQTILSNLLASKLSSVPGVDSRHIVNQGTTELVSAVPEEYVAAVQGAYNYACTRIFLAALGVSLAGLVCSLGVEWKSIKQGKNEQDGSGSSGETQDKHALEDDK